MPTRRPSSLFAIGLVSIFFLILPTSYRTPTEKKVDKSITEVAQLERRVVQMERKVKDLHFWLSDMENHTTLRLLHQELNAVESGVEPSGSWPNYYSVLLKKLNREKVNPKEVNKVLDRMVAMAKKGKYFFPEQGANLEAFYREVENLRPQ
ncbi:MAG: hypothetical protein WA060_02490 [Minisyncoccia bacterium]